MPWHSDGVSKVSILLAGSVIEGHRGGERFCRAGDIVTKPSSVEHSDRVGPDGLCVLSLRAQNDGGAESEGSKCWRGLVSRYRWLPVDPVVSRVVRSYLSGEMLPVEALEECVLTLAALCAAKERMDADSRHWSMNAIGILHDTFRNPPSLCKLAWEVGAHPVSLAQSLRRRTGKTKTEIVHQIRIQNSLSLLQSGGRVSETGHELGFSDQSHFCRVFRRWIGCSPQEYQRRFCQND